MNEIKATAPTPQDWIDLVRENERLRNCIEQTKRVEVMNINWDLAPEGADSLKVSKSKDDNVQWFKGDDVYLGDGKYAPTITLKWETIATRPTEQKTVADAVEQEGEKWTHTWNGFKCKIYAKKGSVCWVVGPMVDKLTYEDTLKPIKPTISEDAKRQLELYVQYRVDRYGESWMRHDLSEYLSHHDIID